MEETFVKVPEKWIEKLLRHAKQTQDIMDEIEQIDLTLRCVTASFIGYASSAETLLKHGPKIK